jgi:multidrug efflux system outer membrane protein
MKRILPLLIVVGLFLSGCKLGPNYARPPVNSPDAWREPVSVDATLANLPWWEVFQDPQLQELIKIALEENKDLKIAVERIEEARAFYGFQRADLYPQVDANASIGYQEATKDGAIRLPEDTDTSSPLYVVGASVFWELDFFGRIRRATEAELALLLSTEEARRFTALTLVSDVARAYMELRDFDLRLEISRRTL